MSQFIRIALALACSLAAALNCAAQAPQPAQVPPSQRPAPPAQAPQVAKSATAATPLELYRQLRGAELDEARVYRVRDVTLDRQALHLSFNDGTIALMRAVDGRITGAFFEGDGEVLVSPTTRAERASLALFTGAAILEEKFTTAFLRFNDETWKQFVAVQKPEVESRDFVARWNGATGTLADRDALRLLRTFLDAPRPNDHLLRARLGTNHFGALDVSYDSLFSEPITVAQIAHVEAGAFYDVWASFAPNGAEETPRGTRRISKFHVVADVHPPHDLSAETELTITSSRGGERVLGFELSRYLKVNSILITDAGGTTPVEFLQNEALEGSQLSRRGNDLVSLILPRPLAANVPVRFKFVYAGSVLSEAGGGLMYVGARGTWYPNLGPAMADFDLEFHSPSEWVLLATGKRVQNDTRGGEQVSRWVSEHPMPVAGFNLGRYDRVSAKAANVSVTAYATRSVENNFAGNRPTLATPLPPVWPSPRGTRPPSVPDMLPSLTPDPVAHAKDIAEISARAIDWLAPRIGEFPYSTLSLTQMPGGLSQGWPGLVFLSSYVFMADDQRTERQLTPYAQLMFSRVMPIHETVHQWWGDEVCWRTYHDQWMFEAISNYLALMALEKDKPEAMKTFLDKYRSTLLEKNSQDETTTSAGPVTFGVRLSSSKFPGGYETVTYGRGTWLIHMLREMLRGAPAAGAAKAPAGRRAARAPSSGDPDEIFFKVLRTLIEKNRYGAISTADLQAAFEAVLPPSVQYEGNKSLDWFFEEWVNGAAVPHFDLAEVKFAARAGHTVASGKIVETEAPKTLVTSLPVYAVTAGSPRPVFVGRVFADEEETAFRLNVPAGTKKLLLDPNQTVLSRP